MFEEFFTFAKNTSEWNHIRSIHVFVAQPKEEQVGHVIIIDIDGDISFCKAEDYFAKFNLNLLEGRIRTLGFRMFFANEDEYTWHKDVYFHKGIVYTSNHQN